MKYPSRTMKPKEVKECELKRHNIRIYNDLITKVNNYGRVAVVAPTGTGKTYLMMRVLQDFYDIPKVVVGPSKGLLAEMRKKPEWVHNKTYTSTYLGLDNLMGIFEATEADIQLIVLDELHRAGASVWGELVGELLEMYPNAILIGFTATPIRHLDFQRNMVDELFNGISVGNMSLQDCIEEGILPKPTYVTAMYDIDMDRLRQAASNSIELKQINKVISEYESNHDNNECVMNALKKHLATCDKRNYKHIVFVSRTEKADRLKEVIHSWFNYVYPDRHINVFVIHSKKANREDILERFCEIHDDNTIDIAITVDMANEGFHIDNTKSVIMLRSTTSPNVYIQQMGRALASGGTEPIIFDFVDNLESLGDVTMFMGNMQYKVNRRRTEAIQTIRKSFKKFDDHTLDFREVAHKVEKIVNMDWNSTLECVKQQIEETGAEEFSSLENSLSKWAYSQQQMFLGRALNDEYTEKFKALGHIAYRHKNMRKYNTEWFELADSIASGRDVETVNNFYNSILDSLIDNTLPTGARVYMEDNNIDYKLDEAGVIIECKETDRNKAYKYESLLRFIESNADAIDISNINFDANTYRKVCRELIKLLNNINSNRGTRIYECIRIAWLFASNRLKLESSINNLKDHIAILNIADMSRASVSENDENRFIRMLLENDSNTLAGSTKKLGEKLGVLSLRGIKSKVFGRTPFGVMYKRLIEEVEETGKASISSEKALAHYFGKVMPREYKVMLESLDIEIVDPEFYKLKYASLKKIHQDKSKLGLARIIYSAMNGERVAVRTLARLNEESRISESECIKALIGIEQYKVMSNAHKHPTKRNYIKWVNTIKSNEMLAYSVNKIIKSGLFESVCTGVNELALQEAGATDDIVKGTRNTNWDRLFNRGKERAIKLMDTGIEACDIQDIEVCRWLRDTKMLYEAGVATRENIDIIKNIGFNI